MARKALFDVDGVLLSHGFVEFTLGVGQTVKVVPDDYGFRPGTVDVNGKPLVPPPSPREVSKNDTLAKLDAAINRGSLLDIVEALRALKGYILNA